MAPVFSRDAWRCVWHLIQVNKFGAKKSSDCFSFYLDYIFIFLHMKTCRMTWYMDGVWTLPSKDVLRSAPSNLVQKLDALTS